MLGIIGNLILGRHALKWTVANSGVLMASFLAIVGFFKFLMDVFLAQLPIIRGKMQELIAVQLPNLETSEIFDFLSFVNAVFPLSEAFVLFSTLYTFWALVLSVRWIKSFIPTVAN